MHPKALRRRLMSLKAGIEWLSYISVYDANTLFFCHYLRVKILPEWPSVLKGVIMEVI